ncbi:NCS2 family permease [Paenibacillus rhizovicinus]|uniref:NCS2 family permease n=1 Tax=Paenibacillus rhizovicinus TaxID=2704463 RepID=A0A6C0NZ49_9BACL|nr:NCS2 family permease [Paenibacillus rhizovicinus]QHW31497.1 NCS2 family permease [Paenibacillus rhizovicinus]
MGGFFRLKEHGTNVRTEIMAGLTTFMTMAYILAVNPGVLGGAGLNMYSVFLATALAGGIFTIAMGLFANFPAALAPGMGLNAYFASTVLASKATNSPISPEMALTAVFISGIIFMILTVTQVRQMLIVAVPDSLKHAITVGIGLFITIIGLKNSGILAVGIENTVTDIPKGQFTDILSFESVFHMGSLENSSVYLTLIGVLLIAVMMVLRVPGAILWGIIGVTIIAICTGDVDVSKTLDGQRWSPNFNELSWWDFDFKGVWHTGLISIIATFTFVELFDTFGTLVGTATRAGAMKDPVKGRKLVGKAMFVDAVGVSGGAMLGTSTVTTFVESSAGIAQGGRTGLTAVTTGVAFLASLFLWPLISLIPGSATAAALIIVGVLMVQSIKEIDFQDMVFAIPSFLTIALMPFTYNIANGVSAGIVSYVVLATVGNLSGKSKYKVHWLMWVLAVLIVVRYAWIGSQG